MHQRKRTLSIDDQKAIDVFLDHAASTSQTGFTRVVMPVSQQRLEAAAKLLSLLSEWQEIDPPPGLAERTLQRIEEYEQVRVGHRPPTPGTGAPARAH